MSTVATNKKALHDYQVLEKIEAGLVLSGPEVKSAKAGSINLTGSYVSIDGQSQAWLVGTHIAPYKPARAHQTDYQANQRRKLLLKKNEIDYLRGKEKEKGLTILPISVYTKGSLIKVEVALVRGKKQYDKRQSIKKREIDRQIRRAMKTR
ncbi:MAG: SsrA-binding protein [Candidatus Buchananbacteria bacterium RIFCSPLOWO2_01_FULL_46_12]|uniref:SsrA-binding protein n=1 Tax=Candidatus Buchananbacteria bacterium RIFCSPLOWO2_01_FULL_46_12 TaxID=1797546 RepID=A0A1G1YMX4_9BACT|nr:MAG: SsrA-binding protein [Candidatus Buchananbacteria bacterium RIFCSPLOWO2_01_FULL_46_12]